MPRPAAPTPARARKSMTRTSMPNELLAELQRPQVVKRGYGAVVLPAEVVLQKALQALCSGSCRVRLPGDRLPLATVLRLCADVIAAADNDELTFRDDEPSATKQQMIWRAPREAASHWVQPVRESGVSVVHDRIGAAKVAVAVPASWNGKLLLLAHGYRAPGLPHFAELDAASAFVSALVMAGWIVGSSSYTSQGRVVVEGVQDMLALRTFIVARFGTPSLCVLEGRSMGGAIATLIAEGQHGSEGAFDGVVAIGAALIHEISTDGEPVVFTHRPLVPTVFLTNQSELGPINKYRDAVVSGAAAAARGDGSFVLPALWEVWREGHNLVSGDERLAALSGLLSWIEHGTFITAHHKNVCLPTVPPALGQAKLDRSDPQRPSALTTVVHVDA
eukprot:7331220-Prymnesium_polylepis.1